MIIGIWDEDIKRLIDLKENDELNESDVEEVADHYNETMDEVYACLIIDKTCPHTRDFSHELGHA